MRFKSIATCALAATVALAPLSAEAHGFWHHRGPGPVLGLVALGAAVVVGTATILTAPIAALASPPPPVYAPPPAYYAAPPVAYYAPYPAYYAARPAYYYR